MIKHHFFLSLPLSLLLAFQGGLAQANEETNRAVRCFFQNLGGCSNIDGTCERFCVDWGCNLAQRDFCSRQGFPPSDDSRRGLSQADAATNDTMTTMNETDTTSFFLDSHGIDFNVTNGMDLPRECFSEAYDLSMVVAQGHLFLSANPDNEESTCPPLVASVVYETGQPSKQLATIGAELVDQVKEKALFVGRFDLATLKAAFGRAIVSTEDQYSMMENNCSVFVMSMLHELGIDVTNEVIRLFAIDELMQSEDIVRRMEEAMIVQHHQGGRRRLLLQGGIRLLNTMMETEQMVAYVVDHNIQHFLDHVMQR